MLRFSDIYYNRDVLSLRIGGFVGKALSPIINPNNLKIEGWYAIEKGSRDEMVLPVGEIRDVIKKGFVVDDHSAITHADDMIRLNEIINMKFELKGKSVVTDMKRRLGKIQDYAVNDQTMLIQKLYISRGAILGLTKQDLVIDRSQILEINDKKIIVKDVQEYVGSRIPAAAAA
jgi:sporulation protein YlmC with PRC-barrel domain